MPGLPNILSQVFGQVSRGFVSEDPTATVAVRVLGRVQEHLFGRWAHARQTNIRCAVRFRPAVGPIVACHENMASTCVACLTPVCLSHAAVLVEGGDLICLACIELARQQRGTKPPTTGPAPVDEVKLRRKYMRWLKLKDEPSEQEIRSAFKREAAKVHPDRMPADKREKSEARFKELGQARDWLIEHLQRRAA